MKRRLLFFWVGVLVFCFGSGLCGARNEPQKILLVSRNVDHKTLVFLKKINNLYALPAFESSNEEAFKNAAFLLMNGETPGLRYYQDHALPTKIKEGAFHPLYCENKVCIFFCSDYAGVAAPDYRWEIYDPDIEQKLQLAILGNDLVNAYFLKYFRGLKPSETLAQVVNAEIDKFLGQPKKKKEESKVEGGQGTADEGLVRKREEEEQAAEQKKQEEEDPVVPLAESLKRLSQKS